MSFVPTHSPHHPHRPDGPERLYALDNLRAAMMWLGIVLHVAVIYIAGPSPLPWRDNQTTPTADLLMAFIHAFRMPVFFILAGFFVALLIERRGAHFAPTAAGSRVELCVTESEEFPEIKVDECFALEEMQEYEREEDAYDSVDFADGRGLRRVIAVLAALFQDVPRTPIPSWQIVDADGETVQFYPDKLMK